MNNHPPASAANLIRPALALLALAAALTVLMIVPDLILHERGIAAERLFRAKTLFVVFAIAALLAAMPSRRGRLWVLAFFALNQIIWTGCAVYFGKALGPDQLLLAGHEVGDTVAGALAEWRTLLPPIGLVLAAAAAAAALLWQPFHGLLPRWRFAPWGLVLALVAASAFWMLHKRIEVAFPGNDTPALYGPLQALVSVVRLSSTSVSAGDGVVIRAQDVKAVPLDPEPQTVVVIMGESINAYRLQVLGYPKETTPRLEAWRRSPPPGFTLIPRTGVSAGTATFGSVPTFLRMAYIPVGSEKHGLNMFDLAGRQGFKTWFLSAQHKQFLDMAGGARNAVRIETDHGNGNEKRLAEIKDDVLLDYVKDVDPNVERRFIFLHQRVNHAAYEMHCTHAPEGMYPFKDTAGTVASRRQANYDNGLRCWDRNVTDLAKMFLNAKGAVHIFIVADHAELMGEADLWGHGFPDVRSSVVPMMLLTNRPDSEAAKLFRAADPPTMYRVGQSVVRAMGLEVSTPEVSADRFYLNSTMPFGLAGFMSVERLKNPNFRVTVYARNGRKMSATDLVMPELVTGRVDGSPTRAANTASR